MRLLAALAALALAGCASLPPPTLTPQPPEVRCQRPPGARTPPAPKADEWLQEVEGAVRLSKPAVDWIMTVLGLLDAERAARANEHGCLDAYEAAGDIRQ